MIRVVTMLPIKLLQVVVKDIHILLAHTLGAGNFKSL
jgi:hypothetical protein